MLQMTKTSNTWLTKYKRLTDQGQKGLITLSNDWHKTARNEQITPHGDWDLWVILAGRGWGKTRTGAEDQTPGFNNYYEKGDVCGKRLTSCSCRFGFRPLDSTQASTGSTTKDTSVSLPFGGFPGARKFR